MSELGICVDIIPEDFVAESLIESIGKEKISGQRFLIPRAAVARDLLPKKLREMGAKIDIAPAYQTVLPKQKFNAFLKRLQSGDIDVLTFTSSSTVTNFLTLTGKNLLEEIKKTRIACLRYVTCHLYCIYKPLRFHETI